MVCDKVIINGTLRKNILYKTLEEKDVIDGIPRKCGILRHCTVYIPFSCFIDVPGADVGDHCQIKKAEVIGEWEKLTEKTGKDSFEELLEKAIVTVEVVVTREQQIEIEVEDEDDCHKKFK